MCVHTLFDLTAALDGGWVTKAETEQSVDVAHANARANWSPSASSVATSPGPNVGRSMGTKSASAGAAVGVGHSRRLRVLASLSLMLWSWPKRGERLSPPCVQRYRRGCSSPRVYCAPVQVQQTRSVRYQIVLHMGNSRTLQQVRGLH
jgi:hypothetical protein